MESDLCSKEDVLKIAANNGIADAAKTGHMMQMMEKLIMCFAIHGQIEREPTASLGAACVSCFTRQTKPYRA